jgi:hypothetical protein
MQSWSFQIRQDLIKSGKNAVACAKLLRISQLWERPGGGVGEPRAGWSSSALPFSPVGFSYQSICSAFPAFKLPSHFNRQNSTCIEVLDKQIYWNALPSNALD